MAKEVRTPGQWVRDLLRVHGDKDAYRIVDLNRREFFGAHNDATNPHRAWYEEAHNCLKKLVARPTKEA